MKNQFAIEKSETYNDLISNLTQSKSNPSVLSWYNRETSEIYKRVRSKNNTLKRSFLHNQAFPNAKAENNPIGSTNFKNPEHRTYLHSKDNIAFLSRYHNNVKPDYLYLPEEKQKRFEQTSIFQNFDADGSNTLEIEEFLEMFLQNYLCYEEFIPYFDSILHNKHDTRASVMDVRKKITPLEIQQAEALTNSREKIEEFLKAKFSEMYEVVSQNGKLSLVEFVKLALNNEATDKFTKYMRLLKDFQSSNIKNKVIAEEANADFIPQSFDKMISFQSYRALRFSIREKSFNEPNWVAKFEEMQKLFHFKYNETHDDDDDNDDDDNDNEDDANQKAKCKLQKLTGGVVTKELVRQMSKGQGKVLTNDIPSSIVDKVAKFDSELEGSDNPDLQYEMLTEKPSNGGSARKIRITTGSKLNKYSDTSQTANYDNKDNEYKGFKDSESKLGSPSKHYQFPTSPSPTKFPKSSPNKFKEALLFSSRKNQKPDKDIGDSTSVGDHTLIQVHDTAQEGPHVSQFYNKNSVSIQANDINSVQDSSMGDNTDKDNLKIPKIKNYKLKKSQTTMQSFGRLGSSNTFSKPNISKRATDLNEILQINKDKINDKLKNQIKISKKSAISQAHGFLEVISNTNYSFSSFLLLLKKLDKMQRFFRTRDHHSDRMTSNRNKTFSDNSQNLFENRQDGTETALKYFEPKSIDKNNTCRKKNKGGLNEKVKNDRCKTEDYDILCNGGTYTTSGYHTYHMPNFVKKSNNSFANTGMNYHVMKMKFATNPMGFGTSKYQHQKKR